MDPDAHRRDELPASPTLEDQLVRGPFRHLEEGVPLPRLERDRERLAETVHAPGTLRVPVLGFMDPPLEGPGSRASIAVVLR